MAFGYTTPELIAWLNEAIKPLSISRGQLEKWEAKAGLYPSALAPSGKGSRRLYTERDALIAFCLLLASDQARISYRRAQAIVAAFSQNLDPELEEFALVGDLSRESWEVADEREQMPAVSLVISLRWATRRLSQARPAATAHQ